MKTLKVKEIIEILSQFDPDMEVYGAKYYGDFDDICSIDKEHIKPTKELFTKELEAEIIIL
jgi:hypothetical protein